MSATAVANGSTAIERQPKSLIADMAGRFGVEPNKFMEAIRQTVMPQGATDAQMMAFLMVANEYKLNPFTREIYAFPSKGGIVPVVSIDGRVSMVLRHPKFNGMEFADSGDSVTCKMWRKDMERPIEITEYMQECKKNTEPWNQMPRRMLRHKAFSQCARYAFGFSGLYDEDEAADFNKPNGTIELEPESPLLKANGNGHTEPAPVQDRIPAATTTIFFHVGKMMTTFTGATGRIGVTEWKAFGGKRDETVKGWMVPTSIADDFLKLVEKKQIPIAELDDQGQPIAVPFMARDEEEPPDSGDMPENF